MKTAFIVLLLFLLYYLILKISFKRDSLKREKEIDSYIEQWRLLYMGGNRKFQEFENFYTLQKKDLGIEHEPNALCEISDFNLYYRSNYKNRA